MPLQPLALAKQNIQTRLQTILDRSQSPAVNFAAAQIHLGSYNLRAAGVSLEELAAAGAQVFVSHAQEGELALNDYSGRFAIVVDLIARSAADSDARDWLDDLLVDLFTAFDPLNWGATATAGPPPDRVRWKTESIDRAARVVRLALHLTFPWTA